MFTNIEIEEHNKLALKELPHLFATLPHDENAAPKGIYRSSFAGPGWLRATAGPGLAIGGLGGWWGKQFQENGTVAECSRRCSNHEVFGHPRQRRRQSQSNHHHLG